MKPTLSSDSSLPEYQRPPVAEVAASIQFANLQGLDAARLGLLWSRFRKDYPRTEQHPPLPSSVDIDQGSVARAGFTVETTFPAPRLWYLGEDGSRLVQVQSNRLIVNWRNLEGENSYPRYSELRNRLSQSLQILSTFLQEENLAGLQPEHAELTYVNHIEAGKPGEVREPLSKYIQWSLGLPNNNLGYPEETSFRSQYRLQTTNGSSARLHLEVDSAYARKNRAPMYIFNLVAKGALTFRNSEEAFAFLDEAHGWIVNAFTELTTSEGHSIWGRVS